MRFAMILPILALSACATVPPPSTLGGWEPTIKRAEIQLNWNQTREVWCSIGGRVYG